MNKQISRLVIAVVLTGFLCFIHVERPASQTPALPESETDFMPATLPNSTLTMGNETVTIRPETNPLRNAYFGDLHVHTAYSFDAFALWVRRKPLASVVYPIRTGIRASHAISAASKALCKRIAARNCRVRR